MSLIGSVWRHKARGTKYVVIGYCMIESTGEKGVLYTEVGKAHSAEPWARPERELKDGRFAPVAYEKG